MRLRSDNIKTTSASNSKALSPSVQQILGNKKSLAKASSSKNPVSMSGLDFHKDDEMDQQRKAQIAAEKQKAQAQPQDQQTLVESEQDIIEDTFLSSAKNCVASLNKVIQTTPEKAPADHARNLQNDVDDVDENMDDPETEFQLVVKPSTIFVLVKQDDVQGNSPAAKKKHLEQAFGSMEGFLGATLFEYKKTKYVKIYVAKEQIKQEILETPFKKGENDEETAHFIDWNELKPSPSKEDTDLAASCTLQVIDLPLALKPYEIRAALSRYGTITKLSTRTIGLYQQTFVQYADPSSI